MMNKNIGDMTESELKDYIIELQEENSRYERRINKAIELIKECTSSQDEYENFISTSETKRLLKILEEVEDKEYEYIEEIDLGILNSQSDKNREFKKAINALIRNQKYILEQLNKEDK